MATLDDPDVAQRRNQLAERMSAYLAGLEPREGVVEMAYAVDGKVRSARWFANHRIFDLVRPALANIAAVDALTAEAERDGASDSQAQPSPSSVVDFVREVNENRIKEKRDTGAANTNEYRESSNGYGSRTILKSPAAAASAGVTVSSDFLAK
jgi:ARG and Rhodanese-Phosphatase-superfamily-associated Protein domain